MNETAGMISFREKAILFYKRLEYLIRPLFRALLESAKSCAYGDFARRLFLSVLVAVGTGVRRLVARAAGSETHTSGRRPSIYPNRPRRRYVKAMYGAPLPVEVGIIFTR